MPETKNPLVQSLERIYIKDEKLWPPEAETKWRQIWEEWGAADRTREEEREFSARTAALTERFTPEASMHMKELVQVRLDDRSVVSMTRADCIRFEAFKYGNTIRATRMEEARRAERRRAHEMATKSKQGDRVSEEE